MKNRFVCYFTPSVIFGAVAILLAAAPTSAALPLFQKVGNILVMSNVNVRVEYNLLSGRSDFFWQNSLKIKGFYSGADLTSYTTDLVYGSHTYTVLSTNQVVVTSTQGGLPTMKQYFTLNQDNSFLTRVEMTGSGLSSTWMGPVVMDTTGGIDIGSQNDCRALCVPFDNDAWTRYNAMSINNTAQSYEVAAFYDNTTRNGLVVGSVTHDTWKTGIYFSGSNNKLNAMNVYGGASSSETRDVMPHGAVVGNTISSPTVFVGFGADWRATLESFADANVAMVPKLAWTNGVPFGWNSWYAFGSTIDHDKAVAVSDFIKNKLQTNGFSNNGAVYVNLDSYWDNMSSSELVDFVNHCHSNGQKAGIYWSPFVWWGSSANLSNSTVEGSSYKYSDVALRTSSGNIQTLDGAIAMDPTHPGIKQRIDRYIAQFLSQGFDFIKLDFLSHGALEGIHYAPGVTTGIQAYNQGMQYLLTKLNGKMFISESIAPIFPYQYAHARRIACDTSTTISETEYQMQSVSYGWWISGRLYPYSDPDVVKFAEGTASENQSRLISGAVSGTVFLNSDDLTSTTGQNLALAALTNAAINRVARSGQTFRPVEGNTGNSAVNLFTRQDGTGCYLAAFNFTSSPTDRTIDLARAGAPVSTYVALDLWSGVRSGVSNRVLNVNLDAKQTKLFRLISDVLSPTIGAIKPLGQSLAISGTGGAGNATYRVLASTNAALQKTNWSQISTGMFDYDGSFNLTITNNPVNPQKFYLLQVP